MIIDLLVDFVNVLLSSFFSLIPDVPSISGLDLFISDSFDFLFNILSLGVGFVSFFIRPSTLILGFSFFLLIENFSRIFNLVMFVLKKIPFLNIK